MAVVFDCSVTLAWFLQDERTGFSDTAFELVEATECWVPYLWRLEFPNALLVAERRGRVGREQRLEILDSAMQLSLRCDNTLPELRALSALAERRALTVYDAAYLELAARCGFDLITLDRRLAEAAAGEGIGVHAPGRSSAAQVRRRYAAQPA
ncbi:MAG TPA: type II toxin-antitoxin system VapC family toxin [Burkholderiales bacterium]|nr:type II toxin-antitoxin system VapC family toxin [Burkholderiales bacterium]